MILIILTFVQCSRHYRIYDPHISSHLEAKLLSFLNLQRVKCWPYMPPILVLEEGHASRFLTTALSPIGLPRSGGWCWGQRWGVSCTVVCGLFSWEPF